MSNIVGTVEFVLNKQWTSSSSFTKTAISAFNGRSASFFRISTNYSISP
jgi:hypothetical protein